MNAVKIPLVRFANQGLHFYVNSIVTKCLAHLISHRFCFIERCFSEVFPTGSGFSLPKRLYLMVICAGWITSQWSFWVTFKAIFYYDFNIM